MPVFFDRYIRLVEEDHLIHALQKHQADFDSFTEKLQQLDDKTYAPGKWTVRDILQHIIDNERIQSYRALRFARKDTTSLPGYDEHSFGQQAAANRRSLEDLLEEFKTVRESSMRLFGSFSEEMLRQKGICFNVEISVLGIGFVIAGHPVHHIRIIEERYLPLLAT